MEEMYKASLENETSSSSTFTTTILHVISGKIYGYVVLVDIPEGTEDGTEVLKATIEPPGLKAKYLRNKNNFSNIGVISFYLPRTVRSANRLRKK